jgi:hypothetical protein
MGVAREIRQDLLGTGEGLFRVDDPFGRAQGRESGGKCLRLVETDESGKEFQLTGIECCRQAFKEQVPEQARDHVIQKKEPGLASDPTLASRRDAATRNDAVSMRMVIEVLTPCVQDGRHSDVGTEVLAIGGNGGEGLGRSLKQQAIHLGLVLVGNRTDRGWKLEHP